MEEEKKAILDDKEVTEDYTAKEDEEVWKWRQMSMKRGSTLIATDEEEENDDSFKEEKLVDGAHPIQYKPEMEKVGVQRRTSYTSKKQQSLNFDLSEGLHNSSHIYGTKRAPYLSEEENYRSMSALDQLKVFQKQQGLEVDDLPLLQTSSGRSGMSSRPKTTGRLGCRERSKSRRSQSIFGQGAPGE